MKILPLFIPHLGCPFDCIYCDQKKISGIDIIDVEKTKLLIQNFCKNNPDTNKEIAFFGGTFTNLPKIKQTELFEQTKPYFSEISGIRISTRPDAIDQEKLNFCKENSVTVIELGIQSFSDEVLKESQRGYSSQTAIRACNKVKENGFELGLQLMPGLPGFSSDSLQRTIQTTISQKPNFVRIYPTLVIKGTKLDDIYEQGMFKPLTLDEAIKITAQMKTEFDAANIKVIKTGLHSDIAKSDIIAGPFHPAFGELVRAEIMFNKIVKEYKPDLTLYISPKDVSLFKGHGGKLIERIEETFGLQHLPIEINNKLEKGCFEVT